MKTIEQIVPQETLYSRCEEDFLEFLRIKPSRISDYVLSDRFKRYNKENNGRGMAILGQVINNLLDKGHVEFKDEVYVLRL